MCPRLLPLSSQVAAVAGSGRAGLLLLLLLLDPSPLETNTTAAVARVPASLSPSFFFNTAGYRRGRPEEIGRPGGGMVAGRLGGPGGGWAREGQGRRGVAGEDGHGGAPVRGEGKKAAVAGARVH